MSLSFPAEVYKDERVAEREGERWAWLLSSGGRLPIARPFPGRWEIGGTWVRLVQGFIYDESPEVWVGTYWTRHGYPEPEAELFSDRAEAAEWALTPPTGGVLSETHETPWFVTATFKVRGTEEDAIVQLAKVVS
jgi:hypothetical protein